MNIQKRVLTWILSNTGKEGVFLINTSRGGIVKTNDVILGLKLGHLARIRFDVVEDDDSYRHLPVQDSIVFTLHTVFFTY